ncbi:uncharacterized protein A1O5_07858 [Cladophialophora psammophila CBS 110553]|uniref:Uncharacterized protein n=1 Tax=Cladophialophora psammophila CBS 110553 TaxID=1182543 RepID=W9WWB1_9EURO|nr:uncharacterized protein A1O5_07858 [Cladophialophora psammophila CBS 110553]EXJ68926.1 hypothetical protein A1O5_07858 [Cladophialophora psammophila CBS 110553]
MFLNSVTRYDEAAVHDSTEADRTKRVTQKPRTASTVSKDDIRPSTSAAAPPVQTEVVTVEPRLSYSGPNQAAESIRRCSTLYVSDSAVYEIIWDENCSSSNSEGEDPSPPGQASLFQSRDLVGAETLERRLSKVLSQSRRDSLQEGSRRKISYVPSSELSVQSIWTNPKIARLFREPASGSLPRSKSSKSSKMMVTSSTDMDLDLALADGHKKGAATDGVEIFPPLRSRANTNGRGNFESPSSTGGPDSWSAIEPLKPVARDPLEQGSGSDIARSRYGVMIGISSHMKRRSVSAEGQPQSQRARSIKSRSRRSSEGKASDDETIPLLGMT